MIIAEKQAHPGAARRDPTESRSGGARWTWAWDGPALALLVAFPAFFLKEVPGGLPPYGGDIMVHVYPLLSLLAHGLHAGRPTLWNFYAAGGYPLAPYSALAAYPPVALALLLWPVTGAIAALYALYLAVLGVGTYLLAGELGQNRPARLLAALTLSCSGFVAAHVYAGHLFELGAVCPLPLAFLALRRAIRRHSLGAALWCGVLLGLMVLAAGVQFLPFALAPLPLLALWHVGVRLRTAGRTPGQVIWPCAALLLAGLVGAALSLVFLIPLAEILGYTLRSGPVPYATATAQSVPWSGLALLVAPDAFGNAAADTYWPASRFAPYFHEIYAYAGVLPLLLAPAALRHRAAWPYGLLALAALLVMLGSNTPLYGLVYALPGGALFRVPARAGLVLDFALALLAGFGLDALRSVIPPRLAVQGAPRWRARAPVLVVGVLPALLTLLALLVTAALAGRGGLPAAARPLALTAVARLLVVTGAGVAACLVVARRGAAWSLLLPALALVDLVSANTPLLRSTDSARYFRPTAAVAALPPAARSARLLALDGAVPLGLGMVTRQTYDVQDAAPLALADYWTVSHASIIRREGGRVATGRDVIGDVDPFFLRLFGVRTLFSQAPIQAPALHPTGRVTSLRWTMPGGAHWNAVPYQATSLIYRDDAVLPRLFVVPRAVQVPSSEAALALLRTGRVDPAHVAVLSPAPAPLTGLPTAWQRSWAAWLAADGDNGLVAHADGGHSGGYLVVDDGWFPGWTATLDGRSVPVLRADDLLRAVHLPPGHHLVRLTYAPLSYLLGAALSGVTACVLLGIAAFMLLRRCLSPRRAIISTAEPGAR